LVVGLDGLSLDDATRDALRTGQIGGLILLSRNIRSVKQVAKLCKDAEAAAATGGLPPPLICIDQEGGNVNRLRALSGAPALPSARSQAKLAPADIRKIARAQGDFLRKCGINVDLAPVVDLDPGHAKGVLATRTYGTDPDVVAECADSFIDGLNDAGVLGVVKHYPGHGLTSRDSHRTLPVVKASQAERLRHEAPFRDAMASGAAGVMVGHLLIPALDPDLPSSLSPPIIGRLRAITGEKLIFTDSGTMRALTRFGSEATRANLALSAGSDIYLTTSSLATLGLDFSAQVASKGPVPSLAASIGRIRQTRDRLNPMEIPPTAKPESGKQ
jgi:beta-N-acetylhexosaminidase